MPSRLYERKPDGSVRARLEIDGVLRDLGRHPNDETALRAVEDARAANPRLVVGKVTVAQWDARWMKLYPGKRNAVTSAHVRAMCAAFVAKHGEQRLAEVTLIQAQEYAVANPQQARYLRQMFGKAMKAGLIGLNVFAHVEIDVRAGSEPRRPPTPQELDRLLATARARGGYGLVLADVLLFTAYSGLRLSEVGDVQVADVLEAGTRLVVRGKRRGGEGGPRVRVVAVFEPGRSALLRRLPDVGRVWSTETGCPLTVDNVSTMFCKLRREAGVDDELTFHGLRHYCATWLHDQGASDEDIAVQLGHQDRAGHVSTRMVQRIYSHPTPEKALARLENVVREGGSDGVDSGAGPIVAAADGGARAGERGADPSRAAQA